MRRFLLLLAPLLGGCSFIEYFEVNPYKSETYQMVSPDVTINGVIVTSELSPRHGTWYEERGPYSPVIDFRRTDAARSATVAVRSIEVESSGKRLLAREFGSLSGEFSGNDTGRKIAGVRVSSSTEWSVRFWFGELVKIDEHRVGQTAIVRATVSVSDAGRTETEEVEFRLQPKTRRGMLRPVE